MLLLLFILTPLYDTFIIFVFYMGRNEINEDTVKISTLIATVLGLLVYLIIWSVFANSCKYFQFVEKQYMWYRSNFHLGLDAASVYFIFLMTLTTTGEYLANALFNSLISMSNTLNFVLLIILILIKPAVFFSFLISTINLRTYLDSLLGLTLIFIIIFYTYLIYGIDHLYNTLSLFYLYLLFRIFTTYLYFNIAS